MITDDSANGGWLSFYWRLILLRVMMWDLRILAQFQESEMSPGLCQEFMDEYIKFFKTPLIMELWAPNQWL